MLGALRRLALPLGGRWGAGRRGVLLQERGQPLEHAVLMGIPDGDLDLVAADHHRDITGRRRLGQGCRELARALPGCVDGRPALLLGAEPLPGLLVQPEGVAVHAGLFPILGGQAIAGAVDQIRGVRIALASDMGLRPSGKGNTPPSTTSWKARSSAALRRGCSVCKAATSAWSVSVKRAVGIFGPPLCPAGGDPGRTAAGHVFQVLRHDQSDRAAHHDIGVHLDIAQADHAARRGLEEQAGASGAGEHAGEAEGRVGTVKGGGLAGFRGFGYCLHRAFLFWGGFTERLASLSQGVALAAFLCSNDTTLVEFSQCIIDIFSIVTYNFFRKENA